MNKIEIYDKVEWHYPEGENCPSQEHAKKIFISIMNWLSLNSLLSYAGKEAYQIGVDSDFSITSSMLTDKGNEVMKEGYSKWLKTISYDSSNYDMSLLEALLK